MRCCVPSWTHESRSGRALHQAPDLALSFAFTHRQARHSRPADIGFAPALGRSSPRRNPPPVRGLEFITANQGVTVGNLARFLPRFLSRVWGLIRRWGLGAATIDLRASSLEHLGSATNPQVEIFRPGVPSEAVIPAQTGEPLARPRCSGANFVRRTRGLTKGAHEKRRFCVPVYSSSTRSLENTLVGETYRKMAGPAKVGPIVQRPGNFGAVPASRCVQQTACCAIPRSDSRITL